MPINCRVPKWSAKAAHRLPARSRTRIHRENLRSALSKTTQRKRREESVSVSVRVDPV